MTYVEPKLGGESFSCPHCGAFAHQNWRKLAMVSFGRDQAPRVITHELLVNAKESGNEEERKQRRAFLRRLEKNAVTYYHESYISTDWAFVNFWVSECYSCDGFSVWVKETVVYPVKDTLISAHEMMPPEVKEDFEEAAAIVNKSPRGAAALLRLCIQKLMKVVGEGGDNINADIASLVRKGLDADVQIAMDVVRVIGNNAVHPGQIDLKDDKPTAIALFDLVNMIVERQIAGPAKLKELFANLPEGAREAIEKRDKPKS